MVLVVKVYVWLTESVVETDTVSVAVIIVEGLVVRLEVTWFVRVGRGEPVSVLVIHTLTVPVTVPSLDEESDGDRSVESDMDGPSTVPLYDRLLSCVFDVEHVWLYVAVPVAVFDASPSEGLVLTVSVIVTTSSVDEGGAR